MDVLPIRKYILLALQDPWENAQELKPDAFPYHRGLVIKQHLSLLHLVLLVCGSRNNLLWYAGKWK